MLLLKACPRCLRGDLMVERDDYGPAVTCLQCGYVGDLDSVRRWRSAPAVIRATPEWERVKAA